MDEKLEILAHLCVQYVGEHYLWWLNFMNGCSWAWLGREGNENKERAGNGLLGECVWRIGSIAEPRRGQVNIVLFKQKRHHI